MMRKKNLKNENHFSILSSINLLFRFFFFLFPIFISAQIYTESSNAFYVSERTTLIENDLTESETSVDPQATIYIKQGTIVSNLKEIRYIKIAYLPKDKTNEKIATAKKATSKSEVKKTPVEVKIQNKVTFTQNKKRDTFFGVFQSQIAATSSPSQSSKFFVSFLKEYRSSTIYFLKQKISIFFQNKNFNNHIESINSIRPPPSI